MKFRSDRERREWAQKVLAEYERRPKWSLTARDWERFAKQWLLPQMPGFAVKGRLIYRTPVGQVLNAFLSERSADKGEFYFWVFAQPLYDPEETEILTIGRRLGVRWSFVGSEEQEGLADRLMRHVRSEGLEFLERRGSPEALLAHSDWKSKVNSRLRAVEAFSLLLVGQENQAATMLDKVASGPLPEWRTTQTEQWFLEFQARCREIAHLARTSPERARERLAEWRVFTLKNLRIPEKDWE